MATSTIWPIRPHSLAKHEILRRYLRAWVPIMIRRGFDRLKIVDGFAGPGRYSGGEVGSPIISIQVVQEYGAIDRAEFLFVEEDSSAAKSLEKVIMTLGVPGLPENIVRNDTFEMAISKMLDEYRLLPAPRPPVFAFVDPFGWSGAPMELVARIMSFPSCEVLFNFNYSQLREWMSDARNHSAIDRFFGTESWKEALKLVDPIQARNFLLRLYQNQLHAVASVDYVRSFELRDRVNKPIFYLFFCTNSRKGLVEMKNAMWKVDPTGEFSFSDATDPDQLVIFTGPNYDYLRYLVIQRFGGATATVAEVQAFVIEKTPFREAHVKSQVLKHLEQSNPPRLEVINPPSTRKRGQFPNPAQRIRFLS